MAILKIFFTSLLLSTSALAAELADVRSLECHGTNVSAVIEVAAGSLRGQIRGSAFHSNTIQIVEVVADLPTEETDGLGGATVGRLGVGQIYVLFQKQQVTNLSSVEHAQLLHMDSNANLHHYPVQCRVTF